MTPVHRKGALEPLPQIPGREASRVRVRMMGKLADIKLFDVTDIGTKANHEQD